MATCQIIIVVNCLKAWNFSHLTVHLWVGLCWFSHPKPESVFQPPELELASWLVLTNKMRWKWHYTSPSPRASKSLGASALACFGKLSCHCCERKLIWPGGAARLEANGGTPANSCTSQGCMWGRLELWAPWPPAEWCCLHESPCPVNPEKCKK